MPSNRESIECNCQRFGRRLATRKRRDLGPWRFQEHAELFFISFCGRGWKVEQFRCVLGRQICYAVVSIFECYNLSHYFLLVRLYAYLTFLSPTWRLLIPYLLISIIAFFIDAISCLHYCAIICSFISLLVCVCVSDFDGSSIFTYYQFVTKFILISRKFYNSMFFDST